MCKNMTFRVLKGKMASQTPICNFEVAGNDIYECLGPVLAADWRRLGLWTPEGRFLSKIYKKHSIVVFFR